MKKYAYALAPIDFWAGWMKEPDFEHQLAEVYAADDVPAVLRDYLEFRDAALGLARKIEWEGDFREGPFVAGLPSIDQSRILIAWKQDNNGTTFVVSPSPLPWLDRDAAAKTSG